MRWRKHPRRTGSGAPPSDHEPDAPLALVLDRLRASQSGVAFIYGAMEVVVARLGLRDLVIVMHDGREGNQIFRYAGKPISPDRTHLVLAPEGVYCEPEEEENAEVDVLFERCRREFDSLRSVGDAATGVISYRQFRAAPATLSLDDQGPYPPAFESDEGDEVDEPVPSDAKIDRLLTSRAFVIVVVVNLLFDSLGVTGTWRFLFGLLFGVAIPGWSLVGLMKLRNVALEISLSIAASLAIILVSAQLLITLHFWHLGLYEAVLCFVCLPSLLAQSRWRRSDRRSGPRAA